MEISINVPGRLIKKMAKQQNVTEDIIKTDLKMLSIRSINESYSNIRAVQDWFHQELKDHIESNPKYVEAVTKNVTGR